jgi:hypothetical protein
MIVPEVAVSRDGQRGILVNRISDDRRKVSGRDATATDLQVRVGQRLPFVQLQVVISGQFPDFWNIPSQTHRWKESFWEAFPDIVMASVGEYLDDAPQPVQPDNDHYAGVVHLSTDFFALFDRKPEQDDARLLQYLGGKLFWGYRLGAEVTVLGRSDAIRFGVSVDDFDRVAWQATGMLWEKVSDGRYRPLPRLLTDFRSGALPGQERSLVEQIEPLLDRLRYPAAAVHITKAVSFLRGPQADLENAAKEAVTAVESVAKVLLATPTATLGDCIKEFRRRSLLPREMGRILESLYAYRSSTPGVGHGGTVAPAVTHADATFVLGVAAVAVRYLDSLWPLVQSSPEANP